MAPVAATAAGMWHPSAVAPVLEKAFPRMPREQQLSMGGVVVSKADHPVIMKAPPGYQPLPALGVPMQVQVQTMPADAMQEDIS